MKHLTAAFDVGIIVHLKECEFRYNMRHEDMYKELLKILRKDAD